MSVHDADTVLLPVLLTLPLFLFQGIIASFSWRDESTSDDLSIYLIAWILKILVSSTFYNAEKEIFFVRPGEILFSDHLICMVLIFSLAQAPQTALMSTTNPLLALVISLTKLIGTWKSVYICTEIFLPIISCCNSIIKNQGQIFSECIYLVSKHWASYWLKFGAFTTEPVAQSTVIQKDNIFYPYVEVAQVSNCKYQYDQRFQV